MKVKLLLPIFIVLSTIAYGQMENKEVPAVDKDTLQDSTAKVGWNIALGSGLAIPLGGFNSRHISPQYSFDPTTVTQPVGGINGLGGFASLGSLVSLSVYKPIEHSLVSVGAEIGINYFKFDINRLIDTICIHQVTWAESVTGRRYNYILPVSNNNWLEYYFMPGFCITFPLKKFSLSINPAIGISLIKPPSFAATDTAYQISRATVNSANVFAFASNLNLNLNYRIAEQWQVSLGASLFYSDAFYKMSADEHDLVFFGFTNIMIATNTTYIHTSIASFDAKLSLVYNLGRKEGIPNPKKVKDSDLVKPSGYVSLGGGAGFPVGIFNVKNFLFEENYRALGSFAHTGSNVNVSAGVPIAHTNFGIAGLVGYNYNTFDAVKYDTISGGGEYNRVNETGTKWINPDYKEYWFLTGLFMTAPVGKLSFDLRLMAGPALCYSPHVHWWGTSALNLSGEEFPQAKETSFAYDAGVGIRYAITKHISALANLDYTHTETKFNVTEIYTAPWGAVVYTNPYILKYPITLINLTGGVAYSF